MYALNKLGQGLIFLPTIFLFSYVLRPIMMLILIPACLVFFTLIGGKEMRREIKALVLSDLLPDLFADLFSEWASDKRSHTKLQKSEYAKR